MFRPRSVETPQPAAQPEPVDTTEPAQTTAATDEIEPTEATDEVEPTAATDDVEPTEAAEPDETADATESAAEVVPRPRKPVGKVLTAVAAVAAALFVAAGAFTGAMLQPYLADRALVNTKLEIARTATNAITTLWTYTPDNMESLPDRSAKYLSGDFGDQYRKYIDAIASVNKQAKVTNNTQVVGAAVESVNGTDATALVYTNTSNSSPQSTVPALKYLSYRLDMQRHDSRWLITKMTTITSLDLTPKLG